METIPPYTYFGLAGPAGLPPPIVTQLNDAITKISAMPDVVKQLHETLFMQPAPPTSPDAFKAFVQKELAKWREVGKNIKLD